LLPAFHRHTKAYLIAAIAVPMAFLLPLALGSPQSEKPSGVSDPSTIDNKLLVGFQGWFRCPQDGSGEKRWLHWAIRGDLTADTLQVDMYPDLREYDPADLCLVPTLTIQGKPAYVYSDYNKNVVLHQFLWMQRYGIDGALAQRFVADIPLNKSAGDRALQNVQAGAETYGRVFAIEYDVSGANLATVLRDLQQDWQYITQTLKLTGSSAYLHDHGKPVVGIWGLGFKDPKHVSDPALGEQIIDWFHSVAGVTIIGGVPSSWATLSDDSSTDPAWKKVYEKMDVIQPWTVGRFNSPAKADSWAEDKLEPDKKQTKSKDQTYMPVIFPGFSWHNLERNTRINLIARQNGEFLWRQAYNARKSRAKCIKIAMFDEYNEATAITKIAATRADAPDQGAWVTLDADGQKLPSDWYLRLAYEIAKSLHSQTDLPEAIPSNPGPH
jgi:hypothetical protein